MKDTKNFALLLALLFSNIVTAQVLPWQWEEGSSTHTIFIECRGYTDATDNSGNVYAGGNVESLLRTSGNIYFGGISVALTFGQNAIWVKYSSTGIPLWADATQNGNAFLSSIATDNSGNLIVFGSFSSPTITIGGITLTNAYGTTATSGPGLSLCTKYFMAKYSPGGTLLWAISDGNCQCGVYSSFGAPFYGSRSLATDTAGNIYITSSFQRASMTIGSYTLTNTDLSGSSDDIFVAKYSPSGSVIWAKSFGGTAEDDGLAITVVPSGDVYVTGCFASPTLPIGSYTLTDPYSSSSMMYELFITRLSSTGVPLWAMQAGREWGAFGYSLTSDAIGDVYMVGSFGDTTINFGTYTLTRAIPPDYFSDGWNALFLVKITPANEVAWGKSISSIKNDVFGYSVTLTCGDVWVSGSYADTVNIEGHIVPLTPAVYSNAFNLVFAGYDVSGSLVNYSGVIRYTGGVNMEADLAGDNSGNVYVGSEYDDYLSFGPDTLTASNTQLWVGKFGNSMPDSIYIHQDTTLCGANSITLTAPAGFSSYLWDNDSTSPTRLVSVMGDYWAVCTSSTCLISTLIDTFHVNIGTADTTYKTIDTSVCASSTAVTISGPIGYTSYLWSSGDSSSSIPAKAPGFYFVVATSGCGMQVDTFIINSIPAPVVSISNDTIFCTGKPVTLSSVLYAGDTYLWSTGSKLPYITVSVAGSYWLKVTNGIGCYTIDTVSVVQANPSESSSLTNITQNETIKYGSSIQLNADSEVYYLWKPDDGSLSNPNINDPIASPSHTTVYTVYGYDQHNCLDSAFVTIYVDSSMNECIPSAFTPNGDGLNDIFRPSCITFQNLVEFRIYNRWGQQVFYSQNYEKGWDGTFNGAPQDMGTYFYLIIVARPESNNIIYKGDVTLIR